MQGGLTVLETVWGRRVKDLSVRRLQHNLPRRCRIRIQGTMQAIRVTCLATLVWSGQPAAIYAQPAQPNPQRPQPAAGKTDPIETETPKPRPKGFIAPQKTPAFMTLEKPLLPADAGDEFRKIQLKYSKAVRQGDLSQRELIVAGVKFRVLRMADKAERNNLEKRRHDVTRDLKYCAKLNPNEAARRAFREFYLSEVQKRCEELLDNNAYVRFNAVLIMAENLNIKAASPTRKIPAMPFQPVLKPLLSIMMDKSQPTMVKLAALRGLNRLLRFGTLKIEEKAQIATSLVAELATADNLIDYQSRLIATLPLIDLPRVSVNGTQRPIIIQSLTEVLVDNRRPWNVRSEAAMALGRTTMDNQIRVDFIANRIVDLARQMTIAFQKDTRKSNQSNWARCFLRVYLAFKAVNAAEAAQSAGLLLKTEKGPLQAKKAAVAAAFAVIHPLAAHVTPAFTQTDPIPPFPKQIQQQLTDYLKQNQPNNFRIDPNEPPVGTPSQPAKPATQPAGA